LPPGSGLLFPFSMRRSNDMLFLHTYSVKSIQDCSVGYHTPEINEKTTTLTSQTQPEAGSLLFFNFRHLFFRLAHEGGEDVIRELQHLFNRRFVFVALKGHHGDGFL